MPIDNPFSNHPNFYLWLILILILYTFYPAAHAPAISNHISACTCTMPDLSTYLPQKISRAAGQLGIEGWNPLTSRPSLSCFSGVTAAWSMCHTAVGFMRRVLTDLAGVRGIFYMLRVFRISYISFPGCIWEIHMSIWRNVEVYIYQK